MIPQRRKNSGTAAAPKLGPQSRNHSPPRPSLTDRELERRLLTKAAKFGARSTTPCAVQSMILPEEGSLPVTHRGLRGGVKKGPEQEGGPSDQTLTTPLLGPTFEAKPTDISKPH
jgi:hypothetical protein